MTITADITLQKILNYCNLNQLANALRKMRIGNMFAPVKVAFTGLTAAATIDITTAASLAAATVTGMDRDVTDRLPPIRVVKTLRVTASATANSVGSYAVTDASGTALTPTAGANVGLALLSDDGKTVTFPSTVTAFVIEYEPRPHEDLITTIWASGA